MAISGATPARAQGFDQVDSAVAAGIARGLYPGAVVLIGRRDTVLYAKGYGHLTWSAKSARPSPEGTLWDLASLTKVVGTASVALRFVDRGLLDLDRPVGAYLPRFSGPVKQRVTVRMLLSHTSGLKPYVRFFELTDSPRAALDLLYNQPLSRAPGDTAVYSDLNALLLGQVVEAVGGKPLDQLVRSEVVGPLGMSETTFLPPRGWRARIAPSSLFRGQPVSGIVNDENARLLGGVAGHAGLFATGRDLARYAQVWLRDGALPQGRWVQPATIREFLTHPPKSGSRLLAWDTPDTLLARKGEPSVFGARLSSKAFGHTGWTGTELWIDPARDLFLVFLTNRSFDPKVRESIAELRAVRATLSDAVVAMAGPCVVQVARC